MRLINQLLVSFLLNACWQIAMVAATVALCGLLVRHSVRFQHLLWAAALGLCLVVPVVTSSLALRDWALTEAAAQRQPLQLAIIDSPEFSDLDQSNASQLQPRTNPAVLVNAKLAGLLIALYALFLAYRALRFFRAWQRTRVIRKAAYAVEPDADLTAIIEKCRRAFPGSRVSLLFSDSVAVPITVGVLKPLVILPSQLLREADRDLLASAIGHEIAHVQRRDYLMNLVYEFLYLPLSFHPAAALVRRRINQTRELCCDELVAERLIEADVYARSLVRLAAAAPPLRDLAATTSVGIADADILEVRIMRLLNRSRAGLRGKKLLLIGVSLMLVIPCAAASVFAVRFDISRQNAELGQPQEPNGGTGQGDRKAKLIYHTEPVYTQDAREKNIEGKVGLALTVGTDGQVQDVEVTKPLYPSLDQSAVATVRQWRFAPYLKDGQPTAKRIAVELNFGSSQQQEKREREEREMKERSEHDPEFRAKLEQREQEEREIRAKRQAELVNAAKISMDQAIQIATSQYPGKVLECNLVGERWEAPGKLGNDSQVFYHVVIYLSSEPNPTTTHVLVNAVDGRVMKAERERKPITTGQLNDRAITLPAPLYPDIARSAGASGTVAVEVTIDENGNVIAAKAVSGHPLLQAAAVTAARGAQFSPTRLSGEPVKVKGLLTYNFVAQ